MIRLLAVALALCCTADAGEPLKAVGDGFVLEYTKSLESEAAITQQVCRESLDTLRRELGVGPQEPVRLRLCATAAEFNLVTGGRSDPATLGLAYPGANWIVINCSRTDASAYNGLVITVRHELCHLAIAAAERSGGRRVPYWFNEGLAVYTSGRLPLPGQGWLPTYVSRDVAIPLAELTDDFPTHPVAMQIAYEQSVDVVRFLVATYSSEAIARVCTGVAAGLTFEEALVSVTGLSLEKFEERWLASLGIGSGVIAFVLRHFGLFSVASLLSVLAFVRYLVRRRRAMARWDREDRIYHRLR